jgi:hypothetical protein
MKYLIRETNLYISTIKDSIKYGLYERRHRNDIQQRMIIFSFNLLS